MVWLSSGDAPGNKRHINQCGLMPNVMAALPNIGGTLCESSVIPFLVPRRKLWLTPTAQVPRSNAANTGNSLERKVNFAAGKIPLGGKIYSIPAQETAKHRANLG